MVTAVGQGDWTEVSLYPVIDWSGRTIKSVLLRYCCPKLPLVNLEVRSTRTRICDKWLNEKGEDGGGEGPSTYDELLLFDAPDGSILGFAESQSDVPHADFPIMLVPSRRPMVPTSMK